MSRPRPNFSQAFTLIELILVLAIIAVIATIAVPSVANFERSQRIGETADQVVALARWARTQAITEGVSYRLNFSPADGQYWLTVQRGASYENALQEVQSGGLGTAVGTQVTVFNDLGAETGRHFVAPAGVNFTCNFQPQPDGLYVEFRSTGRTDPGTVLVTDSTGKKIEVGTLSATEEYHALSNDEKQMEQTLLQNASPAPAR
ncbi:MAG TPA: prepilin-type N-terminal cleavage/methylation domain-containing protein [Tepidisphaeraceae bacterium]|jgi:prepilin-type N-terminal cleavage/methylation domain-containing protein|nr:prepilin-type N-terminal cleavage/methylation domain-containing protein [Tepidisphaeraceae bacterium]